MDLKRPEAVSLFAGAGGLDIGLECAGWHVVAANDFDADCVRTLELNQRHADRSGRVRERSWPGRGSWGGRFRGPHVGGPPAGG